jgi:hypothetical protein
MKKEGQTRLPLYQNFHASNEVQRMHKNKTPVQLNVSVGAVAYVARLAVLIYIAPL